MRNWCKRSWQYFAYPAFPAMGMQFYLGHLCRIYGSLVPDAASGRIYPVQMHGDLYVTPMLGQTMDGLFFLALGCIALSAIIYFIGQREEG
jgi:hypothetical protein